MKKVVLFVTILAVAAVIALFMMGKASRSGQAPGLVDDRLARCPGRPNCVCSEYRDETPHFVEPLELKTPDAEAVTGMLRAAIIETGGSIRSERPDYLAATYASPWFGFVDDLEVRIDRDTARIHFRSASRVGYGDMGANRRRVESLRQRLEKSIEGG